MPPTLRIILCHIRHVIFPIILKIHLNHTIHNLLPNPPTRISIRLNPMSLQLLQFLHLLKILWNFQRPTTLLTPTITLGNRPPSLPIPLIIKTQFLPRTNIPQGKDTRPNNPTYSPSMHHTIRLTRMIDIPCNPPTVPCIEVNIPIQCHNVQHSFMFVPRKQPIEVLTLYCHTNIFNDEFPLSYWFLDHQPPTLQPCIKHTQPFPLLALNTFITT
mmetsp:Transcript_26536/g.40139  ORF Transcript_26536/g.40139 Transcript_26536/m.40139 type:complete len:215 (-) Transcript_26536:412-1056(-)